ncbi:MAG: hypothetical protein ACPGED_10825, partial [Flavobacteriales bacterium]
RVQLGSIDMGAMEFDGAVQDIVYVDIDANGNGSGNSWANAKTNLKIAIEEASVGDEIWVAEGTYFSSSTPVRTEKIELVDQLKLYGGFSGIETMRDQKAPWLNKTIISGNIGDNATNTDNSYRIMYGDNLTDLVIDGFCFRDAFRLSDGSFDRGAIELDDCEATVLNCEFTENRAYGNTGIQCRNTSLHLENSLFHNNIATSGGIVSGTTNSTIEIVGCTFAENEVSGANTVLGALSGTDLTMSNSILWQPGNSTASSLGNVSAFNCILSDGIDDLDTYLNIRAEDPLFVDPGNQDFSITASSNAYDSGDPSYATQSLDLAGNSRISDNQIDRGCFESLVCEQPHDLCSDAIELIVDASPSFGSNRCATNTPDEATTCFVNNGHSVWYTFEAPVSGRAEIISTWVSKFSNTFNIRHVVLQGTCGSFSVLACDNQNSGGQGENTVFYDLTPG